MLAVSPSAEQRLAFAAEFLRALPARGPALLLGPSALAASQLLGRVLGPGEARFDWKKRTLEQLARELALPELAREGRVPLTGLALEALTARVVHELLAERKLVRYRELAERPGFVRALARTLDELRVAELAPQALREHDLELSLALQRYQDTLQQLALADRAHVFAAARRRLEAQQGERDLVAAPLLALDVPLLQFCEAELARLLCVGRTQCAATVARGDERSEAHWRAALSGREVRRLEPLEIDSLGTLQAKLFSPRAERSPSRELVQNVRILSSPGEAREAVEVARAIVEAAAAGEPFDQMAIALRALENYRGVVEEALSRAEIPAHFAEGVRRPLPEGRAFLALLACAREGLSARAFAEYLSLGALPRDESLATPRQWERLLVDASVVGGRVGGRARWTRRLNGLLRELWHERALLEADDPRRATLKRDCRQLSKLKRFATPLLDALTALPEQASWRVWLDALEALAKQSLHEPEAIITVLAELAPLAPVGPVTLDAVQRVLSQRLTSVVQASTGSGAGKVFVGAIEDLRGRSFARVFVMGLAERVFPPRLSEDALLPDSTRRALGAELWLTEERVARERLLLRLAVGAARGQLVLSFPRFDVAHGRPRVPSFYGLEVLQAIDGSLPAFDELTRRAEPGAAARMGFPAPERAELAIDDAEYDLSMLDRLIRAPAPERAGAAHYLLSANVHLARALRFRARRWELQRFTSVDGFVATDDAGRALLAAHRLSARAYSASALAKFAACPYEFFLHAIMRVSAREERASVDELDARQRGILAHRVQRAVLSELAARGDLPLRAESLAAAQELLSERFAALVAEARERYAPSIEGVFESGLRVLERDLHEWLRRELDEALFVPTHFELGFGLKHLGENDPASVPEPLLLSAGVKLSGSIDLVERARGEGHLLRATDYKTGKPAESLRITERGRVLQPLLYALALEQLFPGARVASGRLYFCSSRGEFTSQEVPLDDGARALAKDLFGSIDAMLAEGFLPAAPGPLPHDRERHECDHCDYRPVCGPHEPERVGAVKSRDLTRLKVLNHIRSLP